LINIREIAKKANVSIATASRALNSQPNVSEQTRRVVWKAAQELGYPLSRLKNSTGLTRSVLVLIRDESSLQAPELILGDREFDRTVAIGVQSVLEQHGISTRLQRSPMHPENADEYANDLGVSGLILLGGVTNRQFISRLQELAVPFIIVGSHVHPLQVNSVMADLQAGTQQVVNHLVGRGCRKIGLVNGPETTATSIEKLNGLRLALAIHDLPFSLCQVVAGDFHAELGYSCTYSLLNQCPDLDGVIYADDRMAMGGLLAIKELGKRIPQDIAVASYGNYEIARFTDPPLTSVQYDMHAMGIIAARRLMMLLTEPDNLPWFVVVPTTLIVRQSA
jgi:DNA-binding LacI/PurR family transcriptional regulator